MSFLDNISDHLKTLREQRISLIHQRARLVHDCDCTYCDFDGIADSDQKEFDKLTEQVDEVSKTIKRVKSFAKLHKLELEEVR